MVAYILVVDIEKFVQNRALIFYINLSTRFLFCHGRPTHQLLASFVRLDRRPKALVVAFRKLELFHCELVNSRSQAWQR